MAIVCVLCKMLCVIFLLISAFAPIYSSSDIYLYDTHSSNNKNSEYLSFALQNDDSKHVNRRLDIEPHVLSTEATPSNATATKVAESVASTTVQPSATTTDVPVLKTTPTVLPTPGPDDPDVGISHFSEAANKTLLQKNIIKTQYDTHPFYNSTFTIDPDIGHKHWIDMTNRTDAKINELLSQSHRRAATVRLSFEFPYYGHLIRNITVATGGFLYTGEYVHSWLAAKQYIAPLMANFDTSLSNDSYIKYLDNGTSFTVQWEKVYLQDKPTDGDFTFQTTLHNNGDIVFVYQNIPIVIEKIQDDYHPVKVGLSDAYISDRTIFFVRRKTIYEYHRVNFNREDIRNWTVIYFSALPTCLTNKDCNSSFALQNDDSKHVIRRRSAPHVSLTEATSSNSTAIKVAESVVSTTVQPAATTTEVPVLKTTPTVHINKNLGVNGTGIRKNITHVDFEVPDAISSTTTTTTTTTTPATTVLPTPGPDHPDFGISNFSEEAVNKTLLQNNITKTQYDTHQFYNSTFTIDPDIGHKHWIDMTNRTDAKINELLSQSHRRAATVRLSFDFPFYGHLIRNITIATGGFLYTGEYVHSWLAATQYIAPLMANFDTSLSNDSYIKYLDNGTSFTVQWEKVYLQDKPTDGDFTFQTTLHNNGDIVFVYQNIPIVIEKIQDDYHPVKVGLSDAYISDRTIFFVRRKTIYEYHRVNFNREDIRNWTVIYLSALPTCLTNKDCKSCLLMPTTGFQCSWCPNIKRCSSGMDRHRQDWISRNCEKTKLKNETMCSLVHDTVDLSNSGDSTHHDPMIVPNHHQSVDSPLQSPRTVNIMQADKPVPMGVSGIVTILFLISLVVVMGVWIMYAYRNPHSTSGQILIRHGRGCSCFEYRPSQWSWKRGEARYTAATIHM